MKARSIDKKYKAIEKCLQILSMYSLDKSSFSIKEICDQLNFNVSTTYRILSTLEDYVNSIRLQGNADGRSDFWQNVTGTHIDNMFRHRGHVVDGKFDLAGPDSEE